MVSEMFVGDHFQLRLALWKAIECHQCLFVMITSRLIASGCKGVSHRNFVFNPNRIAPQRFDIRFDPMQIFHREFWLQLEDSSFCQFDGSTKMFRV